MFGFVCWCVKFRGVFIGYNIGDMVWWIIYIVGFFMVNNVFIYKWFVREGGNGF